MNSVKIITVVFLIDSVISLTDVNLHNVPLKTASLLLNTLSKYGNDVKYVQIQPNIWKKGNTNDIGNTQYKNILSVDYVSDKKFVKQNGLHKILIKRLIPHGLSPSALEFDAKYKSFYKPLVRVHKRKPLPKIGTILNIGNGNGIGINKYGIDTHDYYDNDENVVNFVKTRGLENLKNMNVIALGGNSDINEVLLQPFIINGAQNYDSREHVPSHLGILKKIKKLMKSQSIQNQLQTYDYIMKKIEEIDILRAQEKSGEVNNPILPGSPSRDAEDATEKPKKYVPHYPPWNYWTYNKSIHQDMCPLGQVKIANRCIWYPPH